MANSSNLIKTTCNFVKHKALTRIRSRPNVIIWGHFCISCVLLVNDIFNMDNVKFKFTQRTRLIQIFSQIVPLGGQSRVCKVCIVGYSSLWLEIKVVNIDYKFNNHNNVKDSTFLIRKGWHYFTVCAITNNKEWLIE